MNYALFLVFLAWLAPVERDEDLFIFFEDICYTLSTDVFSIFTIFQAIVFSENLYPLQIQWRVFQFEKYEIILSYSYKVECTA